MKNTGKPSEQIFDEVWQALGKEAHCYEFWDASKVAGLNGKRVAMYAQPSDRLITWRGQTHFAEIKSTVDPRNFPFKLLRPKQSAFAAYVLAAGGEYVVYVHRLTTDQWYRIPYEVIRVTKEAGRSSLSWDEIKDLRWNFPTTT